MGTFLRVLVILLLPLTIAALVLGILLFERREMLKGRTQKLETTLMQLAPLIEEKTADLETKPIHPKRDIANVTAEVLDNPDTSSFWDTYKDHLELTDQPTLNLKSKEVELTLFYRIDPVTQKPDKDMNGNRITSGEGTMQAILDDLVKKAGNQLDRVNETRQQLQIVRKELEDTIEELNRMKADLRQSKRRIVELEAQVSRLNSELDAEKAETARLRAQVASLEETIRERDREITTHLETISDRDLEIKNLKLHIEKLNKALRGIAASGETTTSIVLEAGRKASVIGIDNSWKFVLLQLDDAFVEELSRESRIGLDFSDLRIELDLYRPEARGGQYVCRVMLRQVNDGEDGKKVGIADIMTNWSQLPILKDDEAHH